MGDLDSVGAGPAAESVVADTVPVPESSAETLRDYRSGALLWVEATVWGLLVPALIPFTGLSARLRIEFANQYRPWETDEPLRDADTFRAR
ncbi:MAG: hypothetical protein PVH47_05175 [Thiohalocapsa sp.]|jgi:hypothetical protein